MPCVAAISLASPAAVRSRFSAIRRAIQFFREDSLPCPPPLPWAFGTRPPVAFISLTMSLTNLTETLNRAAVDRCVFPSATWFTTRCRSSTGCGFPNVDPHICLTDRESRIKHQGNPESQLPRHALNTSLLGDQIDRAELEPEDSIQPVSPPKREDYLAPKPRIRFAHH